MNDVIDDSVPPAKLKMPRRVREFIGAEFFWETGANGMPRLCFWLDGKPVPTDLRAGADIVSSYCKANRVRLTSVSVIDALNDYAPHILKREHRPQQERIFKRGHANIVNTWTPHSVSTCEPSSEPPELFAQLMRNMFPVTVEHDYMMRWLAVVAMRPAVPIRTSVILRSLAEGVGKDVLIAKVMGQHMLGRTHFVGLSLRSVKGEFNAPIAGKRLIHVEEVYSKDSTVNANKLKALVTNDELLVNEKYSQQYVTDFFGAFVVSSNDKRPLVLGAEDRRWFVPQIIEKVFATRDQTADFFGRLIESFERGNAAKELGAYFEHICRELEAERDGDTEGFFAVALRTPAKDEVTQIDTSYEAEDTLRMILQTERKSAAFQVDTLLNYLNRNGPRISKSQVLEVLRDEGYSSQTRRLGSGGAPMRAWADDTMAYGVGVRTPVLDLWTPL